MTSDPCTKVKFRSEQDADDAIKRMRFSQKKRSGLGVGSYVCPKCLLWHITSKAVVIEKNIEEVTRQRRIKGKYREQVIELKKEVRRLNGIINELKSCPSPPSAQPHPIQEK